MNLISDKEPREFFSDLVFNGITLPSSVFKKQYRYSLFFDAVINYSDELILSIKNVVFKYKLTDEFYLFSSSNINLYCEVNVGDDWVERIQLFNDYLESNGNYDGMILLSKDKEWVVYQENPVRIGVFCLSVLTEKYDIDYFFSCDDIKGWLEGNSNRDIDIVKTYGKKYLNLLLHNYCIKN